MTRTQIIEQQALIRAQITAEREKLPALESAYRAWHSQSLEPCTQALPGARQRCLDDKKYKADRARQYKSQIDTVNMTIAHLVKQLEGLDAQLKSAAQAEVVLAGQGKSLSALEEEATAAGEAEKIKAEAEARAIDEESNSKKNLWMIGGIIAAVLVIIVIIVVVKKLKKKK